MSSRLYLTCSHALWALVCVALYIWTLCSDLCRHPPRGLTQTMIVYSWLPPTCTWICHARHGYMYSMFSLYLPTYTRWSLSLFKSVPLCERLLELSPLNTLFKVKKMRLIVFEENKRVTKVFCSYYYSWHSSSVLYVQHFHLPLCHCVMCVSGHCPSSQLWSPGGALVPFQALTSPIQENQLLCSLAGQASLNMAEWVEV